MTHARLRLAGLATLLLCVGLFSIAAAQGVDVNPDAKGIVSKGLLGSLECDPTNSNLTSPTGTHKLPGCGLNSALQLVYNVIRYIGYIVVPIATLLLGYAGFRLMTSAGNSEQFSEAKSMITKVVIGIVIIFLSTMVIRYVFIALQVSSEFTPTIQSTK
jgi:hypothetical protein